MCSVCEVDRGSTSEFVLCEPSREHCRLPRAICLNLNPNLKTMGGTAQIERNFRRSSLPRIRVGFRLSTDTDKDVVGELLHPSRLEQRQELACEREDAD